MRIAVVGGGPAGLYFAILMKRADPTRPVTVLERDGPGDTFGWGIVFSDPTFDYLQSSDEVSGQRIVDACERWDDVVIVHRGERVRIRGNSFSGIGRLRFLNILHDRCRELGVDLRFHVNVRDPSALPEHDLLVGADGANSVVRAWYAAGFQPRLERRRNRYIWLGTSKLFDGLTLIFRQSPLGLFAAHAYRFNRQTSTFIVECTERTWLAAGFATKTDDETCAALREIFAENLEGHALLTNNFVRWLTFLLVTNRHWRAANAVLLGDALHTAHFSIGSGTKLALEDSIALAQAFERSGSIESALAQFEADRRPRVESLQEAAHKSLEWFEAMADYAHLPPVAFAFEVMTRSKRIDRVSLARRDPAFVAAYDRLNG